MAACAQGCGGGWRTPPCSRYRSRHRKVTEHYMPNLSFVTPSRNSPWGTYLSQIDAVEPYLGHLARWVETLRRPKRALIVDIPIELDNGTIAHYEGYRVQHSLTRGPGKGGVRYHPDVTLEEVMALSAWMTIKNAAMNLPYGGAKGGLPPAATPARSASSSARSRTSRRPTSTPTARSWPG